MSMEVFYYIQEKFRYFELRNKKHGCICPEE